MLDSICEETMCGEGDAGRDASILIKKIMFKSEKVQLEMNSCAAANYFIADQAMLLHEPIKYKLNVIWQDGKAYETCYRLTKIEGLKYLPFESFLMQENIGISAIYAGISGPYSDVFKKFNKRLDAIQTGISTSKSIQSLYQKQFIEQLEKHFDSLRIEKEIADYLFLAQYSAVKIKKAFYKCSPNIFVLGRGYIDQLIDQTASGE